jgi:hypothetical protein
MTAAMMRILMDDDNVGDLWCCNPIYVQVWVVSFHNSCRPNQDIVNRMNVKLCANDCDCVVRKWL